MSNIYVTAQEDLWTNSTIAAEVNDTRDFWWKKAKIQLNWDGTIQPVKACDQIIYPNGCDAIPKMSLDRITSPEGANEFARRFCGSGVLFTCQPKGAQLVFLGGIDMSGPAKGWTPNTPDTTNYLNISAIALSEAHNVIPHEVGHQFQLQHELWVGPSNLMCSNIWCPTYHGNYLSAEQITNATKSAKSLE